MKNVQIIDRAANATFSIFQATEEEFSALFANGQDIELAEDFHVRVGEARAIAMLTLIWERPVLKPNAARIHGTLYYGWEDRRQFLPASKREVDREPLSINEAQRRLFRAAREG